ncbi:f-box and wd40 domain protein [Rutstroemia sp. NJR-2017a BVV2]|nr:f-box and wd40 domain protein [Rutstroemia sp. NJR-2017a BVV2]
MLQQFYKDWRYSVQKDFTNPSAETVKYAPDGFRTWGSEQYKIQFPKAPHGVSVNCDGSLIAIAVEEDIHIYDTVNFSPVLVCKGHISNVDALAFRPGNPKILVSSAQGDRGRAGPHPIEPTILIWNLDEQQNNPMMEASVILKIASQATETVAKSLLQTQPRLELSTSEQESVTSAIGPVITRIVKTHNVANQISLSGRLQRSFQSEIFSPTGSHMIYLPGRRPDSNGSDVWDIKIYSMSTHEDTLTLSGHSDAIMWTGYSPDKTLIGTVAWDQSIRIWNSTTGLQKGRFNTTGQNWTGGFSPDSKRFAGTCGDGSLYIYSLIDGTTLVHNKPHTRGCWMRALSWAPDSNIVAVGDGGIETYDLGTWQKWRFARPSVDPIVDPIVGEEFKEREDKTVDEDLENPLVHGSYSMTFWEDPGREKIWFASIDSDAVRIWDVPMTKKNST